MNAFGIGARIKTSRAFRAYMTLIGYVGRFNTRVVLTAVYVALMPIFALLYHISRLSAARTRASAWRPHEPPGDHERQF